MWRLVKWIITTLWALIFALTVFILQRLIGGKTEELKNLPRFFSFVSEHWIVLILVLVAFGILARIAFQRDALEKLRKKVWLYKSAYHLQPHDFNRAPAWYDPYFIQRPVISAAKNELLNEQGVLLLGVPLLGKTRCAYEICKLMKGYYILGLAPENKEIEATKLPRSFLLRKPKIILFLDDLNRFINKFTPTHLDKQIAEQTRSNRSLVVLATCRSGKEYAEIEADPVFNAFQRDNLHKLFPEELTKEEEQRLAKHFNHPWTETAYNGTPGSIVYNLEEMLRRLRSSTAEARNLMRSLYLVRKIGLLRFRRTLAEQIARQIYEMDSDRQSIEDAWRALENAGFLAVDRSEDTVQPTHVIYLESAFCPDYEFGDGLGKDLDTLWQLILSRCDEEEIYNAALSWGIRQDFHKAEEGLRKCLALNPNNHDPHYALGLALEELGRTDEASQEFKLAIKHNTDSDNAYLSLGILSEARNNIAEAEKQYREAISINRDNAGAHFHLGSLLDKQGRLPEAEEEYREAVRCKPDSSSYRNILSLTLSQEGKTEDAIEEGRKAIECDPDNDDAHYYLGLFLAKAQKIEEAEAEFRKAVQLNPKNADAHHDLGAFLYQQGRTEDAEKEWRESINIDSTFSAAHFNLGVLMHGQGRTKEAEMEYREAIRYGFSSSFVHFNLGIILSDDKRIEEAEKEYRAAITIKPNYAEAHNNLGGLLRAQGQMEEAEKEFYEAIRSDPDFAAPHQNLGSLMAEGGRIEEAEKEFR
jgi:Flp pilus assembly protein TadD